MDIRQAILAAASHLETHPSAFAWHECLVPQKSCGTYGCALGWIGHFAALAIGRPVSVAAREMGLREAGEFYDRMAEANGGGRDWKNPRDCVRVLRLYADRFHPAKPVQQPPNWSAMAAAQTVPADAVDEMVGTFTLAELVAIDKQRVQGGVE